MHLPAGKEVGMGSMMAVRIHRFGGPEVLRYEEAPRPEPGVGDVLIRVHAAGVNPGDWKIREGAFQGSFPRGFPAIVGWDVSGTVESVGDGVTGFRIGDAVYARTDVTRPGAYAEYVAVRARELARRPLTVDHVHAAAVPLAALTAWQALFESPARSTSIGLVKGQSLLIHGAAGGVGTFALQFAKNAGAKVIATGSARNEEFLRQLGADEFVDSTRARFEELVSEVDAVLDTVGGDTQARSWSVLKPGGVLASVVSPPSEAEARAHGVRAASVFAQPSAPQLEEIAATIDAGLVRPIVTEVFPLADARRAHELSQTGHVRGKIVLDVHH